MNRGFLGLLLAVGLVGCGSEQVSTGALRVSFNTVGEVQVRDGARLLPPLEISTPPPSEFRSALSYYRNEIYPDKRLFIVRLTQHEQGSPTERFAVYEIPGDTRLTPTFDGDGSIYQQTELTHLDDGDVLLGLVIPLPSPIPGIIPTVVWNPES